MARSFVAASSQYLEHPAALLAGPPFTVECWFYVTDLSALRCLFSLGDLGSDTSYYWLLLTTGGRVRGQAYTGVGAGNADSTQAVTLNTWQHACYVEASAGARAAYLNGAGKGVNADSRSPAGLDRTAIGRLTRQTPFGYMSGLIAEVALWSVALPDEVIRLRAKGVSPVALPEYRCGLAAYWPLYGLGTREPEGCGRQEMTVSGASAARHPSILRAVRPDRAPLAVLAPPEPLVVTLSAVARDGAARTACADTAARRAGATDAMTTGGKA